MNYAHVGKDLGPELTAAYYQSNYLADGFTQGIQFPSPNGTPGYTTATLAPTSTIIGNPNLTPESTNSFEVGLDLAFLQNRISLNATYFNEKSSNLLLAVPIPYSSGAADYEENAGSTTNNGVELTLNLTPLKLKNGFKWDIIANWSEYRNKVVALAPGVQQILLSGFTTAAIYNIAGQPSGSIYGTGYLKDGNGNIIISDAPGAGYGQPVVNNNVENIGQTQADWIGSITNNFSFKGFTLGIQIDIKHGGQTWDGTNGVLAYFGRAAETSNRGDSTTFSGPTGHIAQTGQYAGQIVHYAPDGKTELPGEGAGNTVRSAYDENYWQNIGSSGFSGPAASDVENSGYVRVREISLSYAFPKTVVKKMHLYSATLTLFANNPILWTKYKGVDPESSLVGPVSGQGLDYFAMPGVRSYGFRLNLGI